MEVTLRQYTHRILHITHVLEFDVFISRERRERLEAELFSLIPKRDNLIKAIDQENFKQKMHQDTPVIKDFIEFLKTTEEFNLIHPIHYVNTGSNVYGLANRVHKEHAGIHMLETCEYLKHPDYRQGDILRFSYDKEGNRVSEDDRNKCHSVTSFEIWKFIDLYLQGKIVVYDMLYLSPSYYDYEMRELLIMLRQGITNKIGKEAKAYVMNNWQKDRTDQRKIVMSFYRLLQAIVFLREEEYVSDAKTLWDYPRFQEFPYGKKVFEKFKNSNFRKTKLSEKEITGTAKELELLIDEINKASILTRLPETTSKDIMLTLISNVVTKRTQLITLCDT